MSKIITFLKDNIAIIKENILISSITVLSSLIIAKIAVFPIFKGKKRPSLEFSKVKLNFLMNFMTKHEKIKTSFYILLPLFNKIFRKNNNDDKDFEDIDDENDTVAKIKKSQKIIQKLTNDFINNERAKTNQFSSQKDKIFYLLLNNMHFIKSDNNAISKQDNAISDSSEKYIENS